MCIMVSIINFMGYQVNFKRLVPENDVSGVRFHLDHTRQRHIRLDSTSAPNSYSAHLMGNGHKAEHIWILFIPDLGSIRDLTMCAIIVCRNINMYSYVLFSRFITAMSDTSCLDLDNCYDWHPCSCWSTTPLFVSTENRLGLFLHLAFR